MIIENYYGMIRKLSSYWSARTKSVCWTTEDFFQLGVEIAFRRLLGFDPRRGELSTYLWRVITNEFYKVCVGEKRMTFYDISDFEFVEEGRQENLFKVKQFLDSVEGISSEFVDVIVHGIPVNLKRDAEFHLKRQRAFRKWSVVDFPFYLPQCVVKKVCGISEKKIRRLRQFYYNII